MAFPELKIKFATFKKQVPGKVEHARLLESGLTHLRL